MAAKKNETWTITFGECVENHVGMVKHGQRAELGFSRDELLAASKVAEKKGFKVEFHDFAEKLNKDEAALLSDHDLSTACILIIRKGAKMFFDEKEYPNFDKETQNTKDQVDKKAIMRGKVVNKHARWNLCYADEHQKAEIEKGKGTILAFDEVPYLKQVRKQLPDLLGKTAEALFAELNYYYDTKKCGIGYHGDTERRLVVAIRIGAPLPLHYQWYHQSKSIGDNIELSLDGGDVYIMAEKATGTDWKKRKIPTLRHAAGYDKKYVVPKK